MASDIAVFSVGDQGLQILLIERGGEPYPGSYALPGGFLNPDETLDQCARRELLEETSIQKARLVQFGVYSAPDRDPRERVISVAYLALVREEAVQPVAGSDAANLAWHPLKVLPALAFDHGAILADAMQSLVSLAEKTQILLDLMPDSFTLTRLQSAFEAVTGQVADKRNFRSRVLESGLIAATGEMERGAHRPAQLYRRALPKTSKQTVPPSDSGDPMAAGRPIRVNRSEFR